MLILIGVIALAFVVVAILLPEGCNRELWDYYRSEYTDFNRQSSYHDASFYCR